MSQGKDSVDFAKSENTKDMPVLHSEHYHKLEEVWTKVLEILDTAKDFSADFKTARQTERQLNNTYQEYRLLAGNYVEFLTRKGGPEYQQHLETQLTINADRELIVQHVLQKLDIYIQQLMETKSVQSTAQRSHKSRKSCNSKTSTISDILARKRAEAEAARLKVEYAKKEAQILKKKAELDADLAVLSQEKEAAAAEAEVQVLRSVEDGSEGSHHSISPVTVPVDNCLDRTRRYVNSIGSRNCKNELSPSTDLNPYAESFKPPISKFLENIARNQTIPDKIPTPSERQITKPPEMPISSDFTRFLLKKDLLLSRLTTFTDRPEAYAIWKNSFISVMQELQVTSLEEMDLLVKWLGPESSKHAISIRSSNADNPQRGIDRIWERLDQRYGSPELVEAALQEKLSSFPRIGNRDYKKLYELADIISEIECVKENPMFDRLLAYYDSSSGVKPIVSKLPYGIQEKWTNEALHFKRKFNVSFPPFSFFADFMREISSAKNDPSFVYDNPPQLPLNKNQPAKKNMVTARKTDTADNLHVTQSNNGKTDPSKTCPLHRSNHPLNKCKGFKSKPLQERKQLLKSYGVCFKCCASSDHMARDCQETVKCLDCDSDKHPSALHFVVYEQSEPKSFSTSDAHGGEKTTLVSWKCTQICKSTFPGKSCAKTVLALVYHKGNRTEAKKFYVMLDDQSNSTLASSHFFEHLNIDGDQFPYILSSCAGNFETTGRKATGLVIEAMDGSTLLELPTVIECSHIPNNRDEIPTPDITRYYNHLKSISKCIPPLDNTANIALLIGRDLPEAHYVLHQLTGPRNSPFAQKLPLGWVIVDETCLGKVHRPDVVRVNKTQLLRNGRPSIFEPCQNEFKVKYSNRLPNHTDNQFSCDCSEDNRHKLGENVFMTTRDDNRVGLSVEDKEFLEIMDDQFSKDSNGKWVAPLPFRQDRPVLPNNLSQAVSRANILHRSLQKNPTKKDHFVSFMKGIFDRGHAEIAPPLSKDQERWYLPIFGVYHPQKPGQIRGVFDSSAQFEGTSLNKVLLTGPDLTNSLLGILLRFRKERIGIMADIQQMFYCFAVREDHRDFLRFIWYRDNDPDNELIEYRMCVHVFGNSPSPAVATYGLRLTARLTEEQFGEDMRRFVEDDFYVDDGLTSLPSVEQATDLMKRTQSALLQGGQIRLHKIASNSAEVMKAFPREDHAKHLMDWEFGADPIPTQRTLGLTWNLQLDAFTFQVSTGSKPFKRRGVLSTVNSIFDPIGFIAPVTIQGKILLRELMSSTVGWDEPLSPEREDEWQHWKESLTYLEDIQIPRNYTSADSTFKEVHVYSDASEKAISAVAYLKSFSTNECQQTAFVLGKSKVAPSHGHTIPRLELCGAVLAVEIAEVVSEQLNIPIDSMKFYCDSRVVLGYIYNRTRRFYVYVANRVERIRKSTRPEQWTYVPTDLNPADDGTRSITVLGMATSKWLVGPRNQGNEDQLEEQDFPVADPDQDREVRPQVVSLKSNVSPEKFFGTHRFERFSSWKRLVGTIARLTHIAHTFHAQGDCKGWHTCNKSQTVDSFNEAERHIVRQVQEEVYAKELHCIREGKPMPRDSHILSLSPVIDNDRLLRVGGRLNRANLSPAIKNPILIPGQHHIATLLIRHHHELVMHQGRHFTEGAVRTAGLWITGAKRLISSLIHHCVKCRKMRGHQEQQKMSDLPIDRLTPAPPFTYVGVDTFGPWSVITRRTRGGQASNKRWAVLFTCLTTRAIHIEVVEELSSSSFINALRRFISIRGPVKQFRSDRGTNFIGAVDGLQIDAVNVEDGPVHQFLYNKGTKWMFNTPHSSHMGGVWERMIGVTRRILDSMMADCQYKHLTHEVLTTFMAEVMAIVNSRPLVPVSTDAEFPTVLSPSMLLTQKDDTVPEFSKDLDIRDMYKAHWKRVQVLADSFWSRWRKEYLNTLQSRRKWKQDTTMVKPGDVILLKDKGTHRNQWPLGRVSRVIPSEDNRVRKCEIRLIKDGHATSYVRPICDIVVLVSE